MDTGHDGYEFKKHFEMILDNCRMHKGISKHKHECWKLWVEQLLDEDMGFSVEAEGNMLRKDGEVFDTWVSVQNWFWALLHLWSPRFIGPHEEFGEDPWSYCMDERTPVWNGIKYSYNYHRDELVGKAMAHLIKTDNGDKRYVKAESVMESAMNLAEELVNEACQEEKKTELVL